MFQTIQSIAEKAAFFFVILFGVLLPFDMLYATVAIYPLIFFTLIAFKKDKLNRLPSKWWVFTIIFLLNVIGYFYSTNTWKAGYLLERQLVILIFPLVLPFAFEINKKNVNIVFGFFTASCFATLSFLFFKTYTSLAANHLSWSSLAESKYYNHQFTNPIGIHATYFALYISLSMVFLLSLISNSKLILKLLYLVLIVFFSVGLFFLASRNTTITIIFIVLLLYPLFSIRHKLRFLTIAVLGVLVFLFFGNKLNYVHERFSIDIIEDLKPNATYTHDNPEPRIMRWQCALELIAEKPIFGYGSGDEIPRLMELYKKKGMAVSYNEEFNTHNQFLSILIKNGAIGLLIFLSMFGYFFYNGFKSKDFLYLSFLTLVVIGFMTENLIDASKGIFYFAFFNTLLGYRILKYKHQSNNSL